MLHERTTAEVLMSKTHVHTPKKNPQHVVSFLQKKCLCIKTLKARFVMTCFGFHITKDEFEMK